MSNLIDNRAAGRENELMDYAKAILDSHISS